MHIQPKKKGIKLSEYEELKKLADRINARKFYEKMRQLTEAFNTGANSKEVIERLISKAGCG